MWASVEIFGPPLLLLAVSGLYFAFDKPDTPMRWRLATSAHGAIAFALFLIAYLINAFFGGHRPYLAWPYILSFLIPVISILYALFHYRGPRLLHILLAPSIAAMLWVMFIGGMAITGDWL